jgi:hypothetical protein
MRLSYMPKALRIAIFGLAVGVGAVTQTASAQTLVGTITSSSPFRLRGATINPGEGVPSWPLLPGDTIRAGASLTIITFTDGSVVSLEPGSDGNVDLSAGIPMFQLANGTVTYSLKTRTAVKLLTGDKSVMPVALTGTYSRNGQRPAGGGATSSNGGFWTPGHTVAVVGAGVGVATAAALGVGASNSSGSQVSPSH